MCSLVCVCFPALLKQQVWGVPWANMCQQGHLLGLFHCLWLHSYKWVGLPWLWVHEHKSMNSIGLIYEELSLAEYSPSAAVGFERCDTSLGKGEQVTWVITPSSSPPCTSYWGSGGATEGTVFQNSAYFLSLTFCLDSPAIDTVPLCM